MFLDKQKYIKYIILIFYVHIVYFFIVVIKSLYQYTIKNLQSSDILCQHWYHMLKLTFISRSVSFVFILIH